MKHMTPMATARPRLSSQLSTSKSIMTSKAAGVSSLPSFAFLYTQHSFSFSLSSCSSSNIFVRFISFSSIYLSTLMTLWNLNLSTLWACCLGVSLYLFLTSTLIPCFSQRYLM